MVNKKQKNKKNLKKRQKFAEYQKKLLSIDGSWYCDDKNIRVDIEKRFLRNSDY